MSPLQQVEVAVHCRYCAGVTPRDGRVLSARPLQDSELGVLSGELDEAFGRFERTVVGCPQEGKQRHPAILHGQA